MTRNQRTIRAPFKVEGIGLHEGRHVVVQVRPGRADGGVSFLRTDLPGADPIPALIGSLGEISDPKFADTMRVGLKKVLRVQQLLKLSRGGGLLFCIDDSSYHHAPGSCPAKERRDLRVLKAGAESLVTVHNTDTKPHNIYVFGIDPSYGVALILPKTGAVDPAQPESRPYRNDGDPVVARVPGTYRFVTIATEEPITAAALEQDGLSRRGAATCNSALEEILCAANSGTRSGAAVKAGKWSAIVETVIVE